MKFSITRSQIKAMLNLSAIKDVRYYLKGINVVQDARGTIIQATDGHILGMFRICDIPQAANDVIIPFDSAKSLAGTKRQGWEVVEFQVIGQDVTASCNGTITTFKAIDGVFPDTLRVTPTQSSIDASEQEVAQFDPALISRFADVSNDLGMKGHVWIKHNGNRAALVSIDVDNFIGVIMPMRGEAPSIVPKWVHAPQVIKQESSEPVAA